MNQSSIINQHSHQVLIIAGEKSAEEHAMGFLPALKERFPHLSFWGVGIKTGGSFVDYFKH